MSSTYISEDPITHCIKIVPQTSFMYVYVFNLFEKHFSVKYDCNNILIAGALPCSLINDLKNVHTTIR